MLPAKGGLKMLTRNIASEYGEYNIQCNGIGPGYIATPQTAPLRERQADGSRHPFDAFIVAKTPAARWGTPEDLMGPAVFLASDASNFVNGHVLYVDGGILATSASSRSKTESFGNRKAARPVNTGAGGLFFLNSSAAAQRQRNQMSRYPVVTAMRENGTPIFIKSRLETV